MRSISNIVDISNDLRFFNPVFGCDKFGQNCLPITHGAPHIYTREMQIQPIKTVS